MLTYADVCSSQPTRIVDGVKIVALPNVVLEADLTSEAVTSLDRTRRKLAGYQVWAIERHENTAWGL